MYRKIIKDLKYNRGLDTEEIYQEYFKENYQEYYRSALKEFINWTLDEEYNNFMEEDEDHTFEEFIEYLKKYFFDYYFCYRESRKGNRTDILKDKDIYSLGKLKNYLKSCKEEVLSKDRVWEQSENDVKRDCDSYLQEKYDDAWDKVNEYVKKLVSKLKQYIPDIEWDYTTHTSHSWCAGDYPSNYFTISGENKETREDAEIIIRLSDLHDNGRNESDIELNWYDLDIDQDEILESVDLNIVSNISGIDLYEDIGYNNFEI